VYSADDLKSPNWRELVIKRQDMYFGTKGANPEFIATGIANGALLLGCMNIEIRNIDGFWLVASDKDWFKAASVVNVNESDVFNRCYTFPEAGQNCFRYESFAEIFSSSLITFDGDKINQLKGDKSDVVVFKGLLKQLKFKSRVVGFAFTKAI